MMHSVIMKDSVSSQWNFPHIIEWTKSRETLISSRLLITSRKDWGGACHLFRASRPQTSFLPFSSLAFFRFSLKHIATKLRTRCAHLYAITRIKPVCVVPIKELAIGVQFKYDLFIPFFRRLRHPRVSLLMAVCLDPHPEHLCLVMEHFEFASLNHLLYKTQIEMNLPERVHCLLDVAEGMTFLHNHSIIHGFLNSFSVFIYEAFRAKIGNLEFSQENGEQKQENACSVHESWMAPEQLLHEPPNMAGDAYRLVLAAFS